MSELPATDPFVKTFQEELERLNPAQLEAVTQIEGPVLVIAGPGTGKTHILAARIGRILTETDTQPHNILCLTFTDAGVQAMRRRLLKLIGPEAHRVHIFTFHSFCNNVIQSNLELFGRRELEPLSELEQVEIIRRIIDELPHQHILKSVRGDTYFYEGHLKNLFQLMKKEDWDSELIHERIDEYLADLPTRDDYRYKTNGKHYKKGDLKTEKLENAARQMQKLKEGSSLFPIYTRRMLEMKRYDYDDMILWVLEAFRTHPYLLRSYQEQYLYFLVDEFQDTNGAQNEILHQLIDFWESPNVFIVGDDDQSIYEFQGARLKNIAEFYLKYRPTLTPIVLTQNYRSSQSILDASREVIQRNEIRVIHHIQDLGLDKILVASHPAVAGSQVRPVVAEYPTRLHEEVDIADQIAGLAAEGVPLEEIAVIYAKHRQADRLMELLNRKGIPYRTRKAMNILDMPVIQNLRLLIDYLNAEFHQPYSAEHLLFRIMHFDFLGFDPHDLARFAVGQIPAGNGTAPLSNWRDRLGDLPYLSGLGIRDTRPFQQLDTLISRLLATYINRPVPLLIELLVNRSGLLLYLLQQAPPTTGGQPFFSAELEALFAFSDFISKEAVRNPRLTPARLSELLKSMDANRISLPLFSALPAGMNGQTPVSGAVNLLTAHSSKGLEFSRVFMLDCVKNQWEGSQRTGIFQFSMPDTLTLSGEEDATEARRRLFYVAMTRAKEHLQISYAAKDDGEKEIHRSQFVDEMLMSGQTREVAVFSARSPEPATLLQAQTTLLIEKKPVTQAFDREAIGLLLENFTLSVSSLNSYLRCPLSFYYEKILRVPALPSEAAHFGTAMHNALYRGFQLMLGSTPRVFPPANIFVNLFEQEMSSQQIFFSRKEFERRMTLGKTYLDTYVQHWQKTWTKDTQVEVDFRNLEVDGVPVTGIIDRIDNLDPSSVHLVDYKTGSQDRSKVKRPDRNHPHGGNYWRQLVFYKILYESSPYHTKVVKHAEISYLEPDPAGNFVNHIIEFEQEDVLLVRQLIKETYSKIMGQAFYEGCGEPGCTWCRLLLHHDQADSMTVPATEELDDR